MNQKLSYSKMVIMVSVITGNLLHAYAYLPDEMSLSNVLMPNAHNSPQSIAYHWRYAQQMGTVRDQWNAGARGVNVNLHWRIPMTFSEHMAELAHRQLKSGEQTLQNRPTNSKMQGFFKTLKTKANKGLQSVTGRFIKKQENKGEPFIALGHEEDTGGNCMLSAYLQKSDEVDTALSYFTEFARLMEENPTDIGYILIDDYTDRRTDQNGASMYSYSEALDKLNGIIEQSGLARFAFKADPNIYFAINGKEPQLWPTIGELRRMNKRLIIFTLDQNHAKDSPYLNPLTDATMRRAHWEYSWEADIGKTCKLLNNSKATLFSIGHGAEASIQTGTVPSFALAALKKFGFNLRAPGGGAIKGTDYKILNNEKNIRQRVVDCEQASPLTPVCFLGLDFIEEGGVYETIKNINRERAQKMGLSLRE